MTQKEKEPRAKSGTHSNAGNINQPTSPIEDHEDKMSDNKSFKSIQSAKSDKISAKTLQ